jgi:hypothetical protein
VALTIFQITITPEEARSGDVSTIVAAVRDFVAAPERARQRQGTFTFVFSGYDDRPEPIGAIPETRLFVQRMYTQLPGLLYFAAPERELGNVMTFMSCFARPESIHVSSDGMLAVAPDDEWIDALARSIRATMQLAVRLADDADRIVDELLVEFPQDFVGLMKAYARK